MVEIALNLKWFNDSYELWQIFALICQILHVPHCPCIVLYHAMLCYAAMTVHCTVYSRETLWRLALQFHQIICLNCCNKWNDPCKFNSVANLINVRRHRPPFCSCSRAAVLPCFRDVHLDMDIYAFIGDGKLAKFIVPHYECLCVSVCECVCVCVCVYIHTFTIDFMHYRLFFSFA